METPQQVDVSSYEEMPTGIGRRLALIILSVVVLLVSVASTFWMLNTVPRSRRRKPRQYATLVQVQTVTLTRKQLHIEVMGTVRAARQVTIFPRVRGEVIGITRTLLPGGLFRKGRRLLRIDAADYRLLVAQRKSALDQARSSLALEIGRQRIARREFKMLKEKGPGGSRLLMLRRPQLDAAKAAILSAKSALSQARLNLRRTRIRAPFDAVIVERMVHKGSRVTETTPLVRLAGTKRFWVDLSIAVDQLKWISIPQQGGKGGSLVKIYNPDAWGPDVYRVGRVLRLYPGLETQGRMARLLVEVLDPLGLKVKGKKPPRLLLGSYVKAKIIGRKAPPAVVLPRRYLRDDDTVWLMGPGNKLVIRTVSVMFRGPEEVLIHAGLREGEKLITTLLPTPVAGMPLRSKSSKPRRKRRKRREAKGQKG